MWNPDCNDKVESSAQGIVMASALWAQSARAALHDLLAGPLVSPQLCLCGPEIPSSARRGWLLPLRIQSNLTFESPTRRVASLTSSSKRHWYNCRSGPRSLAPIADNFSRLPLRRTSHLTFIIRSSIKRCNATSDMAYFNRVLQTWTPGFIILQ